MSDILSPLDYLLTCSDAGLESFELSRMGRAANLRKECREILEQWVQSEVDARVARCMLECKCALGSHRNVRPAESVDHAALEQLSIPLLPPSTDASCSAQHERGATAQAVELIRDVPVLLLTNGTAPLRELENFARRSVDKRRRPHDRSDLADRMKPPRKFAAHT